jgi:DNA repair protein RAD5
LNGLLKKFRQRCGKAASGNDASTKQGPQGNTYSDQVAQRLSQAVQQNETHVAEECPICLENPAIWDAVVTNCAHIFCRDCLVDFLRTNDATKNPKNPTALKGMQCPDGQCPSCQSEIEASKIIALSKSEEGKTTTSFLTNMNKQSLTSRLVMKNNPSDTMKENNARKVLENAVNGAESSKLAAVVQELHNVWKEDPGSKVLIFSQFLGFLDLMETALREGGIPFGRLDGKLSLQQRVSALEAFKQRHEIQASGPRPLTAKQRIGSVMLVSMKTGGVGLNLTAASTVFIVGKFSSPSGHFCSSTV